MTAFRNHGSVVTRSLWQDSRAPQGGEDAADLRPVGRLPACAAGGCRAEDHAGGVRHDALRRGVHGVDTRADARLAQVWPDVTTKVVRRTTTQPVRSIKGQRPRVATS